jgi:hypothetical protein
MFKFSLSSVLFGITALCCLFACSKAPETFPTYVDNRPIISMDVNGAASNFKVGATLTKDSNTLSLSFEYLISPGPNFTVAVNRIPNQTGTYKIAKNFYPALETNGSLWISDGDAIYESYPVYENVSNSITISNIDVANKKITGNLKCTFIRESSFIKGHNFPDTIIIEKSGFTVPYTIN